MARNLARMSLSMSISSPRRALSRLTGNIERLYELYHVVDGLKQQRRERGGGGEMGGTLGVSFRSYHTIWLCTQSIPTLEYSVRV